MPDPSLVPDDLAIGGANDLDESHGGRKTVKDTLKDMEAHYDTHKFKAIRRTFTYTDPDVAVAANSAAIDLGGLLPTGAVVKGLRAQVVVDWDDGAAGAFGMDVGDGSTADAYNPTAEIDLDGGPGTQEFDLFITEQGGIQPTGTIFCTGIDLDTLTGGQAIVTLYYEVPEIEVEAPPVV